MVQLTANLTVHLTANSTAGLPHAQIQKVVRFHPDQLRHAPLAITIIFHLEVICLKSLVRDIASIMSL